MGAVSTNNNFVCMFSDFFFHFITFDSHITKYNKRIPLTGSFLLRHGPSLPNEEWRLLSREEV